MISDYDPGLREWREDPYPHYRALRAQAPVHFAKHTGVFCVSRYDDVMFVLNNPEIFSSRAMFSFLMNQGREGPPPLSWKAIRFIVRFALQTRLNPFGFATARNLIAEDGARHSAMRGIVNRGFTPRRMNDWEQRAQELVDHCMQKLHSNQPFDVVRDLSIPLPVTMIAEMLGVAPEKHADFKRWSDAIIKNATGPGRDDPFATEFTDTIIELANYIQEVAAERKRNPADDLVSAIVAEQLGESTLSVREVMQFVMLILVAGNETTTNLIGNAVTALLGHPEQLDRLIKDPALVPAAIEEVLRFDAPVQLVFRITTQDVEVAGTTISKGSFVAPLLGSANRDESRFEDPDSFDVGRNPQGHVGFGFGKHFCLGASLARLEARTALEALVPELPRFQLDGPLELVDSFLVRGPKALPLRPAA